MRFLNLLSSLNDSCYLDARHSQLTNGSFISVRTGQHRRSRNPGTHLSNHRPPPAPTSSGREPPAAAGGGGGRRAGRKGEGRAGQGEALLQPRAPHRGAAAGAAAALAPAPLHRGPAGRVLAATSRGGPEAPWATVAGPGRGWREGVSPSTCPPPPPYLPEAVGRVRWAPGRIGCRTAESGPLPPRVLRERGVLHAPIFSSPHHGRPVNMLKKINLQRERVCDKEITQERSGRKTGGAALRCATTRHRNAASRPPEPFARCASPTEPI